MEARAWVATQQRPQGLPASRPRIADELGAKSRAPTLRIADLLSRGPARGAPAREARADIGAP